MKATITLEQLSEKLKGKLWSKGDKKRIYLDEGYNTKKMKTSTYVEIVGGEFLVKCFVECPSQDFAWCKSQANIVIENVEAKMRELLADTYFYVVNEKTNEVIDDCRTIKLITDLYVGGGLYLTEKSAERFIELEEIDGYKVSEISRDTFEKLQLI